MGGRAWFKSRMRGAGGESATAGRARAGAGAGGGPRGDALLAQEPEWRTEGAEATIAQREAEVMEAHFEENKNGGLFGAASAAKREQES